MKSNLTTTAARSGLEDYRVWITRLRTQLPKSLRLSLTGLPDWLHSADLPALVATVDGFTLQLHAVDQPELGLFAPDRALAWTRAFAELVQAAIPYRPADLQRAH